MAKKIGKNTKDLLSKYIKRFVTGKMKVPEIAKEVGCSPSNVYYLLRALGVSKRTKKKLAAQAKKAAVGAKAAAKAA